MAQYSLANNDATRLEQCPLTIFANHTMLQRSMYVHRASLPVLLITSCFKHMHMCDKVSSLLCFAFFPFVFALLDSLVIVQLVLILLVRDGHSSLL